MITLNLKIDNIYEGGDKVRTRKIVNVPEPPQDDESALEDWEDEYIFSATGAGIAEGDAAYFVEVEASTNTDLIPVGTEWEYGL